MAFFYNLAIHLYALIIRIASLFNHKAKLFVQGRKNNWAAIEAYNKPNTVWFHAASLGEFEQGKPVMEALLAKHPELNLVVTFFSPSGYNEQKNYSHASVFYLPLDTKKNAQRFLAAIQPKLAVFIRYEIWPNYLDKLKGLQAKTAIIAAQFRGNQFAFSNWGSFVKKRILNFNLITVQYNTAKAVLVKNGFDTERIVVCGDSRFDRTTQNVDEAISIPEIEAFKGESPLMILGSCYQKEEEFVYNLVAKFPNWKFLYAPHFVDEETIRNLEKRLPANSVRYSKKQTDSEQIMILDTIGKLAMAYQYADISVVGGGFIDGIHNIIEPASFGSPIFIGPNHSAFPEAAAMHELGIVFEIKEGADKKIESLMANPKRYKAIATAAREFVSQHRGATHCITNNLEKLLP